MKCPNCDGTLKSLGDALYCLDCDWDNLEKLDLSSNIIGVDVEWYLKTQLKKYRYWSDADFKSVSPDWVGGYRYNYTGHYFHCTTVAAHEATETFGLRMSRRTRRQKPVPVDERITELAWTVCVSGAELMAYGWSKEMLDALPTYRQHTWRKKRLFRLCDLSKVSKVFKIKEGYYRHSW